MPLYSFADGCGEFDRFTFVGARSASCPVCGRDALRQYTAPALKVQGAPIPDSEPAYQNEHDRKALKKKGWDGDRAVEHLRTSKAETAIGTGIDMKKANDSSKWNERRVF